VPVGRHARTPPRNPAHDEPVCAGRAGAARFLRKSSGRSYANLTRVRHGIRMDSRGAFGASSQSGNNRVDDSVAACVEPSVHTEGCAYVLDDTATTATMGPV